MVSKMNIFLIYTARIPIVILMSYNNFKSINNFAY